MHASILSHARYRYFWIAVLLCAGALLAYVVHEPLGAPFERLALDRHVDSVLELKRFCRNA